MAETSQTSDKGIGLALVFGALAVAAAFGTYITTPADASGWAFAAAVTFGVVLVVAVHAFWS